MINTISQGASSLRGKSLLASLYIIVLSFPFIGLPGASFDTQPWAYIVSVLLMGFLIGGRKLLVPRFIQKYIILSLLFLGIKIAFDALLVHEGYVFSSTTLFRQIFSYTSIIVIFLAVYNYGRKPNRSLFYFVFVVWFFSGVLQIIVPDIFSSILPRVSTSDTRGVTGLASEPTHYARQLALLLVLAVYLFYKRVLTRFDLLFVTYMVVFNVLFVAKSFTGLAFIGPIVITVAWVLYPRLRAVLIPFTIVLVIGFFYAAFQFMPGSRLVQLTVLLFQDPESLSNFGAYRRITNVPTSLYVGFVQYSGWGLGFGREFSHIPSTYSQSAFSSLSVNPHGGVLGIVHLAGVLGIPWILFWVHLLFKPSFFAKGSGPVLLMLGICLAILCFFEGTTAQPFLAYVASIIYKEEYQVYVQRFNSAY